MREEKPEIVDYLDVHITMAGPGIAFLAVVTMQRPGGRRLTMQTEAGDLDKVISETLQIARMIQRVYVE